MGECRTVGIIVSNNTVGKEFSLTAHIECLDAPSFTRSVPTVEVKQLIGAEITTVTENYPDVAFCDYCDEPLVPYIELYVIIEGAVDEIQSWGQGHLEEAEETYNVALIECINLPREQISTWSIELAWCNGSMNDREIIHAAKWLNGECVREG
jgi:hypothetical protein